jgi:hypothetical protein
MLSRLRAPAGCGLVALALSFLAFASPAAAEDEEEEDSVHAPRTFDVDLTLFQLGFSLSGHLGRGFFLGGGVSAGPALSFTSFSGLPGELVALRGFARYEVERFAHVDVGLTAGYFQEFNYTCVDKSSPTCGPSRGALLGPYVDVRYGWPGFKLGPRVWGAVRTDSGRTGVMLFPMFIELEMARAPRPRRD